MKENCDKSAAPWKKYAGQRKALDQGWFALGRYITVCRDAPSPSSLTDYIDYIYILHLCPITADELNG